MIHTKRQLEEHLELNYRDGQQTTGRLKYYGVQSTLSTTQTSLASHSSVILHNNGRIAFAETAGTLDSAIVVDQTDWEFHFAGSVRYEIDASEFKPRVAGVDLGHVTTHPWDNFWVNDKSCCIQLSSPPRLSLSKRLDWKTGRVSLKY